METNNIQYKLNNEIIQLYGDFKLTNVGDAMDAVLSATYEHNSNKIILMDKNLDESFFDLKTKFAGELLQKLVNYNCTVAIVGEFEQYGSKALSDFIFECNRKENVGSQIFFVSSIEDAIVKLSK